MKVSIIGITGRIGLRVARECLARGWEVVGVNKRPQRGMTRVGSDKPVFIGADISQAGDLPKIIEAVRGSDVLVYAGCPMREDPEKYPQCAGNLLTAAREAGVSRVIYFSNYVAVKKPGGGRIFDDLDIFYVFYDVTKAQIPAVEVIENCTDLDWLVINPPASIEPYGPKTGRVRVIADDKDNLSVKTGCISLDDLAAFAAAEIQAPGHHKVCITVTQEAK